jgi:hypothetical protein
VTPKSKARVKKSANAAKVRISGRAKADTVGVARVQVAIARISGGRCSYWSERRKRFVNGSCLKPMWVRAGGTSRWSVSVSRKALKGGRYAIRSRAIQRVTRVVEPSVKPKSVFSVVAR